MQLYALALGSNRRHHRHGGPAGVLAAATEALAAHGVRVIARSRIRATPALGPAGRGFANAALLVETPLDPPALLAVLKRIERDFGRRPGRRWGPRVLDIDIALWSGGRWPQRGRAAPGRLSVPHAALAERSFVLDPLSDLFPQRFGGMHPRALRHRLSGLLN
ncbi:2-amino-4-hydroxy-6-hydroxymethyldihydropteridine diphosphokinase [Sphingomonas jatrophae]|uniref:2-amino-4-hydroxy-6-hydroxymethyldihydropteridine pyrophosphokinase n=1 Tax=Sphingomonas jatrophae TaxID=1166337 RepID=A0A1I6L4K6_9SPHN|nr:2-amino-4-hydroxy-6-hydroxymethyldihydropteridine diphosphokinase [Sphingomonas jatrophae]SFR98376.1 2-amino-4-hydroxy-6-hydroxymethyldihydropteridinediphosphokinase [Sphingomonas jatrophae]